MENGAAGQFVGENFTVTGALQWAPPAPELALALWNLTLRGSVWSVERIPGPAASPA